MKPRDHDGRKFASRNTIAGKFREKARNARTSVSRSITSFSASDIPTCEFSAGISNAYEPRQSIPFVFVVPITFTLPLHRIGLPDLSVFPMRKNEVLTSRLVLNSVLWFYFLARTGQRVRICAISHAFVDTSGKPWRMRCATCTTCPKSMLINYYKSVSKYISIYIWARYGRTAHNYAVRNLAQRD